MEHNLQGHYSKKHAPGKMPDERLVKAIREKTRDGEIPCAVAHTIAKELNVSPKEVGFAMDMLEIPITKCQLGLFGYKPEKKIVKPAKEVSSELKDEIMAAIKDGKLSCEMVWNIAKKLGLKKMDVSSACEKLGIKIGHCQLGAF